jgi:peroxiredoxin
MAQLELMKGEIERTEAQLTYIAAEKATGVWKPAKFLAAHPVSFPFLLDVERIVTKAYGLYHRIGIDALNIAHPATLVVERDQVLETVRKTSA